MIESPFLDIFKTEYATKLWYILMYKKIRFLRTYNYYLFFSVAVVSVNVMIVLKKLMYQMNAFLFPVAIDSDDVPLALEQ